MTPNEPPYPAATAQDIALRALGFLAGDETILTRFLGVTGWTPETLAEPGARAGILNSALEYLMSEEDLLLTFAANSGVDPAEIARACAALNRAD